MQRAFADVDLSAVARNIGRLRSSAAGSSFMAVVKADGYGHGMIPIARTCREAGAEYLGVALPSEAEELRESGDNGSILTWLYTPEDDLTGCVAQNVDISVASIEMLEHTLVAAQTVARKVRLHLKADTGLGRNGCQEADWADLLQRAKSAQAEGRAEILGIWSHLSCADDPDSEETTRQVSSFEGALAQASDLGVEPRFRHLANSAGTMIHPETHYDMVRCGIAVYGLSPGVAMGTEVALGLEPAMSVRAGLALVKDAPAGQGVSYGLRYRTASPTRLALVPVGYADGLPRAGSGKLPVQVAGKRITVAGTVAMDQIVLDVGDLLVESGDTVDLFGTGRHGEPTASEWARICGTINYEIVTRLGSRIPRRYSNGQP